MDQKEKEIKSKLRLDINRSLLGAAFTVFGLIVSLKTPLLRESILVPMQLTLSIPLLLSSIFARSKLAHTSMPQMWEDYGYATFLFAYSFLINVVGILLTSSVSIVCGLTFLIFSVVISWTYSFFEVKESKAKLFSRIKKELLFTLLIVLGGILPVLRVY